MDIKELRGLMEAYQQVNAPEQLDELSVNKMLAYGKAAQKDRDVLNKKWDEKKASHKEKMRVLGPEEGEERAAQKIKKKTGKYPHQMNALDKARYAVTKEDFDIFDVVLEFLQAEGYAETLEEAEWLMANVIDEEAIGIILGEALTGERYKKAVKKPGGTAYSRMVSADPKKRATRGGRGGESDFGAGDRGSGNKAARRAGTYQEEEFAIDEASSRDEFTRAAIARSSGRKGGITFEPGPNWDPSANRGKGAHLSPKQKEKQRRKALRQEEFEAWLDEAMTNYEKNRKRAAQRAAARNAARDQGKTGAVPGVGYVTPRRERETWTDESGKTRHAKGL